MKKILSYLLCLLLVFSLSGAAGADVLPWVIDEAGLLTESQRQALEEKANSYYRDCEMDVVILTVESTNGQSVISYADDYYDSHAYGYGDDNSGILLLLVMDTREWYFSTCGKGIFVFTDYGLEEIGQAMIPDLSAGDYYAAFDTFLDLVPQYYEAYSSGQPIDGYAPPDDYYPEGGEDIVYDEKNPEPNLLVSLVIGLAVAGVAVLMMRSSMKTTKKQHDASDYLMQGSYHLNTQRDLFLYRRVTKTAKPQNNGGSGRGGGSSVHRSSSGRSHGGRGGRF